MKNKIYQIQIPGKTFISGEYLALFGGSSLLVSTEPGFQCFFLPKRITETVAIDYLEKKYKVDRASYDPQFYNSPSPAGKYYQKNADKFQDWEVYFFDGYQKKGGFGASTAQFLALYHFVNLVENGFEEFSEIDLDSLLVQYWMSQEDAEKKISRALGDSKQMYLLPSGNDLMAQQNPGFSAVSKTLQSSQYVSDVEESLSLQLEVNSRPMKWGFEHLEFFIVPTGNKLATHKHLEGLEKFDPAKLKDIQERIESFFFIQDEVAFIVGLKEWHQELLSLGFVCTETQNWISKAQGVAEILGIKGCGAMGSDVLFVAFHRIDKEKVANWLKEQNLNTFYSVDKVWKKPVKIEGIPWD